MDEHRDSIIRIAALVSADNRSMAGRSKAQALAGDSLARARSALGRLRGMTLSAARHAAIIRTLSGKDNAGALRPGYPAGVIRSGKKARRLLVGDRVFFWSVRHQHLAITADPAVGRYTYQDCRELLVLRRNGAHGRLLITFRQGEARFVPDGIGPGGVVGTTDGRHLNLNEPGAARAVLDEAEARGISVGDAVLELDGWELYDAAVARIEHRRSAARQP